MTIRGHNEGSIFKRTDGRWVAMLSLPSGKRQSFYGKTRQEVQRRLAAAQRDLEAGIPVITDRQTVGQYLTSWLEAIKPTIEFGTWRRHREFVELHVAPKVGHTLVRELSPQQVQRLYADCLATGLSGSTVHHLHATLHKALKDAERLGIVARNVCKLVNPPRMDESEIQPLSRDDVGILLDIASGERLEALYVVALATGMRQSELLGLRWSDVDLDARPVDPRPEDVRPGGLIRVRTQLKRLEGQWVLREPKTRRSRRQIAVPDPVVDALRRHHVRQLEERLRLGAAWQDRDLVFCTQTGGPLFARNLYRSFKALLRKGALPDIRFHDLRHTCATLLLSAWVNPKVVSEMLGHATVAITLDIYSHVLPDMQQDAAVAMGQLLYGSTAPAVAEPETTSAQVSWAVPMPIAVQTAVSSAVIEPKKQWGNGKAHREVGLNSGIGGAGGTGIEPATCGFGDRCSA
jgi:integrase